MTNFKKTTLSNGLRIITVPSSETKTAAVLVLVKTGSKYETKDINGISHFLEHMFFKGTKKRSSTLKLIEPLDKVGGEYNAFTGEESTGYWAKLDARHLDLALDWVSDIYLHSLLEQKEINKERGTILQELNMYLDTPMRYVHNVWAELLYGDQPAGWPIIGDKGTIESVQRDNFVRYFQEHYSTKNTVIAVAGDISHSSAVDKIKKYFKGMPDKAVKDKLPVQERQAEPGLSIYHKKTDQTHLILGARAYNIFHPDKYALGLLSVILGGNMSSRLFISVREKQGLAYYVHTGVDADTDTGFLATNAGVDNQKAEKAIKTIIKEYQKISRKKVSQKELKKAKEYVKGRTLIDMESSDEQASYYAFQELLTDEILTVEERFAKIEVVTADDIQRVAQDIFRPEKLNLAMIGPFQDKAKFEKLLSF